MRVFVKTLLNNGTLCVDQSYSYKELWYLKLFFWGPKLLILQRRVWTMSDITCRLPHNSLAASETLELRNISSVCFNFPYASFHLNHFVWNVIDYNDEILYLFQLLDWWYSNISSSCCNFTRKTISSTFLFMLLIIFRISSGGVSFKNIESSIIFSISAFKSLIYTELVFF